MEDSDFQISSDFDGTEVVVNETIENNVTEIEDDRIPCTNNESLNKILQIAVSKATNVAQHHKEEGSKSKFVARFTEVFCDIIHANVCVDGLPWTISTDTLTREELQKQELETDDARLSKLSKEMEKVAKKRKTGTKECRRIREIRFKHHRQNLRKLEMESPESISSPSISVLSETMSFPHKELAQICKDLNISKTRVQKVDEELLTLQKNLEIGLDILKREKARLDDDTGYISCPD